MADTVQTAPQTKPAEPPVVVKKYANRRLYDTRSSSYITLDNLAEMVRARPRFRGVRRQDRRGHHPRRADADHRRGGGQGPQPAAHRVPAPADRLLRRPDAGLVPRYLEQAMAAFAQQQEQMRAAMQKTMGSVGTLFPFGNMEEVSRQNMAMMERAFSLFTPFYRPTGEDAGRPQRPGMTPWTRLPRCRPRWSGCARSWRRRRRQPPRNDAAAARVSKWAGLPLALRAWVAKRTNVGGRRWSRVRTTRLTRATPRPVLPYAHRGGLPALPHRCSGGLSGVSQARVVAGRMDRHRPVRSQ